jgi:hypothetical protein
MNFQNELKGNASNFKQSYRQFLFRFRSFFSSLFHYGFCKFNFVNVILFLPILIFSGLSFYGNFSASFTSLSVRLSEAVGDHDSIAFCSDSFVRNDTNAVPYSQWKDAIVGIHRDGRAYSRALALFAACNDSGSLSPFQVQDGSSTLFSASALDFCNYNNEDYSSSYFGFGQFSKFSNQPENLNFSNYDFSGRTGGSYISTSFGEKLAKKRGCSLTELIGSKFSISTGGHAFSFSINNLIFSTNALGVYAKQAFGDFFVTNSNVFWSAVQNCSFIDPLKDQLITDTCLKALKSPVASGQRFSSFFVDGSSLTPLGYSEDIFSAIKNSESQSFFSISSPIFFSLFCLFFLGDFAVFTSLIIWRRKKQDYSFNFYIPVLDLVTFAAFLIVLFFIFSFQANLVFTSFVTFQFVLVGAVYPCLLLLESFIFSKVKPHENR